MVVPVVLLFELAAITFRFYHLSVTGFLVPDEAYYYETFIIDHIRLIDYREVFVAIYLLFFSSVNSFQSFVFAGYAFAATWATAAVAGFYFLIKETRLPEHYGSAMLISLALVPVFTLMLLLVLTETVALALALFGLLFTLRYVRTGNAWTALLSSILFVLAYKVREPYLILAVGNLFTIALTHKRNWRGILAYLVPLSIVLSIPVSLQPLQLTQPLYSYVDSYLHHIYSNPTITSITNVPPPTTSTLPPTDHPEREIMQGFALGFGIGYGPVLAALVLGAFTIGLARLISRKMQRIDLTILWNSALSILGMVISLSFLIYPAPGLIPVWTSAAVRISNVSLPAFLSLRYLYERSNARRLIGMLLLVLVVTSAEIPVLITAFQTNLAPSGAQIDRLSLNYRAPYYRLYLLAKDAGKTLIIVGFDSRGLRTFCSLLPNVTITGAPADEGQFRSLISGDWNAIFLYDDVVTIKDPTTLGVYPQYYQNVVLSSSYNGHRIIPIWVDGESYALKLVPPSQ